MASNQQKLTQTQGQRLGQVLSPQQVRYFRLLEMNDRQFEEEVRREVDENPALEFDAPDKEVSQEYEETAEQLQMADFTPDERPTYQTSAAKGAEPWLQENTRGNFHDAMTDDLLHQVSILALNPTENLIARYIVGNLDASGYLRRTSADIANDIANVEGIEVTPQQVRTVLKKVQTLDPPGIAAVDLRECLMLQLQRKAPSTVRDDTLLIITHYFDIFARRNFKRLAEESHLDESRLHRALELIRTLDPKPGGSLTSDDPSEVLSAGIIPDFQVEIIDGSVRLTMPATVPALHLSETFTPGGSEKMLGKTERECAVQAFIRRQQSNASGFIDIVALRRRTLMRIMSAIVDIQKAFFISGDQNDLRPMILKDVAERTGDDISVVSRATNGKYVETPHGIYPLKFFFNEEFGDNITSRAITEQLRRLVDAEDPHHPLSDTRLAEMLNEAGFPVARRTVAKYRDQMSIPPSRLRIQP